MTEGTQTTDDITTKEENLAKDTENKADDAQGVVQPPEVPVNEREGEEQLEEPTAEEPEKELDTRNEGQLSKMWQIYMCLMCVVVVTLLDAENIPECIIDEYALLSLIQEKIDI